jgi:hypothetical protein
MREKLQLYSLLAHTSKSSQVCEAALGEQCGSRGWRDSLITPTVSPRMVQSFRSQS